VLAAQEELIKEALRAKDSLRAQMGSSSGKEAGYTDVHQLLVKLEKVSAELLEEKKRSLELCRELAAEKQQNKRVRTGAVELDLAALNRGSSSTLQSASSLPLSGKFTQTQTTQVQIQTTQVQIQPASITSTRKEDAMHTLHFGRPPTSAYPISIIATQRFNRTEQQVDLSVGHWKQALQKQTLYIPELPPRRDSHESNIKRAARRNEAAHTQLV
jgi:hypothetical protein